MSNRVFVLHGHDTSERKAVARLRKGLGLDPAILYEKQDKGRTIIEKLENYEDFRFAVVLLTPDDVAAPAKYASELMPRARQSVGFELGCFIGRLGRMRVCESCDGRCGNSVGLR